MSLIHDALKKAQEKEQAPIGSGLTTFQEAVGGKRPLMTRRAWTLLAVLAAALGFIAYEYFFAGASSAPQAPAPAPAVAPQELVPSDPAALKKRAMDAFKAGDLEAAWKDITLAAMSATNDPEAWNDLGLVARKRGDLAKAREAYQKALALRPDFPEALNNLGVVELQDGNGAAARELFEKALAAQPGYPEANFNLALFYDHADDMKSAATYYRRFLQVSGDFPSDVVESVRDRILEIEQP